jgi:tetratricopeptide (TPR) repeat protein
MAIREFKKALALTDQESLFAAGHRKARHGKLLNNLAQSYYQLLRKLLPVEEYARSAVAVDETNLEQERNEVQRLYKLSRTYYQRALRIHPGSADAHNNLGDLFYVMNNYPDAEEEYMMALKLNPDNAEYYNNLGLVYYGLKNYDGAEEKFSGAISLQPDFLEARNNLALVYLHRGMYQKALEQLEMLLSCGHNNAGVYFNLALVYLRGFHDSERAAYYLRESLRLNRHISKDQMVRDSSCGRNDSGAVDRHT